MRIVSGPGECPIIRICVHMKKTIKLGFIGLDTSHVTAFAQILHDEKDPWYLPGGKVVVAYPGGSQDWELSCSRVAGFTNELRDRFGVEIVSSITEVSERCDAILIESVDGRVHLEQFRKVVGSGKPIFIDKPLTVSWPEARTIASLASEHKVPVMTGSALRFSESVTGVFASKDKGAIIGADVFGPMALESTQPGLFWYGIHTVEMLYAIMGQGCESVASICNVDHDVIIGTWKDGRMGVIRGNRKGNNEFGGWVHREGGSQCINVSADAKPFYRCLLERVVDFFDSGIPAVSLAESLEVIAFIEAANASRGSGRSVELPR